MVSENLLGAHLVAVGHGNIVHLVAETYDKHVPGVSHGSCNTRPNGDVLLSLLLFPVAYYNLARLSQA